MRSISADSSPGAGAATFTNSGRMPISMRAPGRQRAVALVEGERVAGDPRLAALHLGRQHVHARRADEVADEGVGGPHEQLLRRAGLHHAALVHHHDRVGEGQRLGLVVRDVDHREVERAVQHLELRAQLPLQPRIDHGERLVEQDRRHVGAHQAAAERDLLLGVGRQAVGLAGEDRASRSSSRAISATRASISGARQAAVLEREGEVLAHRHGVVDHRELEHLGDVALLRRQRHDVLAVEQHRAARRPDDAGDDVEQGGLAAARRSEQRVGAALAPGHRGRLQRKARRIGIVAAVGVRKIDEVDAGHRARLTPGQARRPAGRRGRRRRCRWGRARPRAHGRAGIRGRRAARRPSSRHRA